MQALRPRASRNGTRMAPGSYLRAGPGDWRHPLYLTWAGMIYQCHSPSDAKFGAYGGRGIDVCNRWRFGEEDRSGFQCFLIDMGPKPSGRFEIDRIIGSKGYSSENCRWATKKQQNRNRNNSIALKFKGVTKLLVEWCDELRVSRETVYYRLSAGWSVEEALTTPVSSSNRARRRPQP